VTADRRYLVHAEHALDFMYRRAWDQDDGGWFSRPTNGGSRALATLQRLGSSLMTDEEVARAEALYEGCFGRSEPF
jgi:hypothetical protein